MTRPTTTTNGFTLLELMITLAIAVILMMIAAPSWQTQTADNRLTAATNQLVGALAYARSEAVKQGRRADLCSSNDITNATPSCTGTAWETGWLIWLDADNDNSFDSPGEIVRVSEALRGGTNITTGAGTTSMSFDPTGFTTTPDTFLVCDANTGDRNQGRQLRILTSGSVSLTTGRPCP